MLISMLLGTAGWYYHTTTDTYAFNQVKAACEKNDIEAVAFKGLGHINGETREFTNDEIRLITESLKKTGSECPYSKIFAKKVTKTKLPSSELQRLKVTDLNHPHFLSMLA